MRQFVHVEEVVPNPNRDGASSPILKTTRKRIKRGILENPEAVPSRRRGGTGQVGLVLEADTPLA